MGVMKRPIPPIGKENRVTEQAGRETQDINLMAKKAFRNRLNGNPEGRTPVFGETSSLSYHEQMNAVLDIQNKFNQLPARTRAKFQNNPYVCLKFVEDPANAKQAVKMGLLVDETGVFDEPEMEPPTVPKAGSTDNPPPTGMPLKADPEANPRK